MSKQARTKRSQIKDLSVTEQEITEKEMQKVKGRTGEGGFKYTPLPAENHELKKLPAVDESKLRPYKPA